jgi:hypothetical protein
MVPDPSQPDVVGRWNALPPDSSDCFLTSFGTVGMVAKPSGPKPSLAVFQCFVNMNVPMTHAGISVSGPWLTKTKKKV